MLNSIRFVFFILLWAMASTLSANSLFDNFTNKSNTDFDEPLDAEQAFVMNPPIFNGKDLIVGWTITKGYYLYREKFQAKLREANGFSAGSLITPAGIKKNDPSFGEVEVIHDQANIQLPLTRTSNQAASFIVDLTWQGCFEKLGVCYPPQAKAYKATAPALAAGQTMNQDDLVFTDTPLASETAPSTIASAASAQPANANTVIAPVSEQNRMADIIAGGNIGWIIASFFGFGLLLSLTPCILPMIPILSGIIIGQKNITSRKAFLLSLTYVLAMAFTYTLFGILAGLFGSNLQATFQNPWIISAFALVFVLLALSMFGFYELQLPLALQNRLNTLSQRQSGGNLIGVAIMGVLSALIVGPCVAAPLMGALIYIGQTGDAVLGGLALFALSLGMGAPLLLIGSSAGQWLPKTGAWMNTIKAIFGVLLLGVAIYLLERILPSIVTMFLWGLLLIVSAVYMGAVTSLPSQASNWQKLWKGVGIVIMIQGALILTGGALGTSNPLNPLKGAFTGQSTQQAETFQRVQTLAQFQTLLTNAKGKPVLLDFYADWCVSCKEMESYTFSEPEVQAALKNYIALQVDVTQNTADDKAFLKQFNLVGPPATLYFDKNGQEQTAMRQVGFIKASDFVKHLQLLTP